MLTKIRRLRRTLLRYDNVKRVFLVLIFVYLIYSIVQILSTLKNRPRPVMELREAQHSTKVAKKNFVYIKMIKCGSTTLNTIFHRFGYTRNLSFVLPVSGRIYLGWPYGTKKEFYRPSLKKDFNILCEHAVYDRPAMAAFMPSDTMYITSLREPYSQFKSMYNYYNLGKISTAGEGYAGFNRFMKSMKKYDEIYKSGAQRKERYCIPDGLSMTKNLMSFTLGLPLGYPPGTQDISEDRRLAYKAIKRTVEEFDLILILEYFHESLVLLKRLMRWNIKDILYKSANVLKYEQKHDRSLEYRQVYKKWSHLDFLLYDHANTTFWAKVSKAGGDFRGEVEDFVATNNKVKSFCLSDEEGKSDILGFDRTRWNDAFIVTRYDCSLLLEEGLLLKIKTVYDVNAKAMGMPAQPEPSKYFC